MTLNEYQEKAQSFDITKDTETYQAHAVFGLAEEVGELLGKFKRRARGDYKDVSPEAFDEIVLAELGDCLWYVAAIAASLNTSLNDVAVFNISKLEARKAKGVIKGSGER